MRRDRAAIFLANIETIQPGLQCLDQLERYAYSWQIQEWIELFALVMLDQFVIFVICRVVLSSRFGLMTATAGGCFGATLCVPVVGHDDIDAEFVRPDDFLFAQTAAIYRDDQISPARSDPLYCIDRQSVAFDEPVRDECVDEAEPKLFKASINTVVVVKPSIS